MRIRLFDHASLIIKALHRTGKNLKIITDLLVIQLKGILVVVKLSDLLLSIHLMTIAFTDEKNPVHIIMSRPYPDLYRAVRCRLCRTHVVLGHI